MFGYHGNYLRIDVTTGEAQRVSLDESTLRAFVGGSGLGVKILLDENAAEVEPLSPEAVLAFVFSPLVGSPLTTSAKFAVVSKSPLTERINDSLASSGFAIAGKKSGHDAVVITGCAAEPSILVIEDESVRLVPGGHVWGMTTSEAETPTQAGFGRRVPACRDRTRGRAAGSLRNDLPRRASCGARWKWRSVGIQEH